MQQAFSEIREASFREYIAAKKCLFTGQNSCKFVQFVRYFWGQKALSLLNSKRYKMSGVERWTFTKTQVKHNANSLLSSLRLALLRDPAANRVRRRRHSVLI